MSPCSRPIVTGSRGHRGSASAAAWKGSAWSYGFLGLGLGFLNVISLGWTKPWADSVVFKYRLSRTWFGNGAFGSGLDASGLYGRYALAWFGAVFGLVVAGLVLLALARSGLFDARDNRTIVAPWLLEAVIFLVQLLPLIAYQLIVCAYKAALVRNIANTLTYGPVRFRAEVTFGDVFRLRIPNLLLLAFTLGLAYPYVVMRTTRFIARHVEFHGDIRTAAIGQTEVGTTRYGEGLMEFFGIASI